MSEPAPSPEPVASITPLLDYVPPFTREEVLRRVTFLSGRCFLFKSRLLARHPTWKLEIDPLILVDVAKSAMDDIWRYKIYHLRHPNKKSNSVKRAAYFSKWVVRLRPIYVVRPLEESDFEKSFDKGDYTLLANEAFALFFALTTLATEAGVPKISLTPNFMGRLLYDLHYRLFTDDALLEFFQLIHDRAKGEDIIVL
jgi:hypothetical protein